MQRYLIYGDEAWTDENDAALRYHHFYHGCLLKPSDRERIQQALLAKKTSLGLKSREIKWSKVTHANANRIGQVLDAFFDYIDDGSIRYRHLFLDKQFRSNTAHDRTHGYFILYYFFVVWGFGLPVCPLQEPIKIEFLADRLPDAVARKTAFKDFLLGIHQAQRYRSSSFQIDSVSEIDSCQHIIHQCCDLIAGAFGFRLNRFDKKKAPGQHRRSRTTVAKAQLYKRIYSRIVSINRTDRGRATFNAGQTTSRDGDWANLWNHKIRIWKFIPSNASVDESWLNRNWTPG